MPDRPATVSSASADVHRVSFSAEPWGVGGQCPECDQPVLLGDLVGPDVIADQFVDDRGCVAPERAGAPSSRDRGKPQVAHVTCCGRSTPGSTTPLETGGLDDQ